MSGYSAVRQQESRRDFSKAFCRHGFFFINLLTKIFEICVHQVFTWVMSLPLKLTAFQNILMKEGHFFHVS